MRGLQGPRVTMSAFVDLEASVPLDHPLRTLKMLSDQALSESSRTTLKFLARHGATTFVARFT